MQSTRPRDLLVLALLAGPACSVRTEPPPPSSPSAAAPTSEPVEVELPDPAIPAGGPSLAELEGVWIRHEPAPQPPAAGPFAGERPPRRVEGWIIEAGRARKLEPQEPARLDPKLPDEAFLRETAGTLELVSPCSLIFHATGARRRWIEPYTVGRETGGAWFLGGELTGVRIGEQLVLCGVNRVIVLAEGRCGLHTRRDDRWISDLCGWELAEASPDRVTLRGPLDAPLELYLRGDLLFTKPTPDLLFEPIEEPELRRRVAAEGRARSLVAWQRAQPGVGMGP